MSGRDLPFRCRRCGAFVRQERLHEADDFGPGSCRPCKRRDRAVRLAEVGLTARTYGRAHYPKETT